MGGIRYGAFLGVFNKPGRRPRRTPLYPWFGEGIPKQRVEGMARYFLRISDVVHDPLFRERQIKMDVRFSFVPRLSFVQTSGFPREWGIRLRPVNPTTYDLLTPKSMTQLRCNSGEQPAVPQSGIVLGAWNQ